MYKNILVAVDLTDESKQVAEKAIELALPENATVRLIHVIEPLSFAYGGDVPLDLSTIQAQLDEHAQQRLDTFSSQLQYTVTESLVVSGHTESEVHRIAEEQHTDLIVVGSHGRHGFALLLGSTASGILRGASCDVLAVRVREEG